MFCKVFSISALFFLEYEKKVLEIYFFFFYDEKKEVYMIINNLGIPSHLMPDTALLTAVLPRRESCDFVAYPDTGNQLNSNEFKNQSVYISNHQSSIKNVQKNRTDFVNEG